MAKKKFEFNKEINYFTIDPSHLDEGLRAAEGKHDNIRIMPLDLRSRKLSLDADRLSRSTWIRGLMLHHDIPLPADEFRLLERLTGLEELSIKEMTPLDYSCFPRLRELVLSAGTDLPNLERVRTLELVYLTRWNSETLPDSIGRVAAAKVRISASRKLVSIEPLCGHSRLQNLMMQDLPLLEVGNEINKLTHLEDMHVEKSGWTDFSILRIRPLRKLFASKVESLQFIKQLPNLEHVFFWDCVDGDLTPVLEHPALKRVDFAPEKKHYSHKRGELKKLLAAKRAGVM